MEAVSGCSLGEGMFFEVFCLFGVWMEMESSWGLGVHWGFRYFFGVYGKSDFWINFLFIIESIFHIEIIKYDLHL